MTILLTPTLHAELQAEAWESELSVSEYIGGLLARRYKWARTVGTAGGYDLAAGKWEVKLQAAYTLIGELKAQIERLELYANREFASRGGKSTSLAKRLASHENGKLGGRPRK